MAGVVSRRRIDRLQRRLNPTAYNYVTEDKGVFYPLCRGAEIPVPELYAVFDPTLGWSAGGKRLGVKTDWVRFFQEDVGPAFVIKPTWGVHGLSLYVMSREGTAFVDFAGRRWEAGQLYDAMAGDPRFARFIVQERVFNHPDLAALSGSAALQTMRVVTAIEPGGAPEILFAVQKLVAGENAADNFRWGRSGNIVAEVALDQGRIVKAVTGHASGLMLAATETHPRTGKPLIGFQLPHWPEVRELVRDAARKFLPIRTIGWDVAIAPDGPLVLEANMWWHPDHHNALGQTGRFLYYLARSSAAR